MKDLEWQVSNKELSEKLRDLGCKQDSLWYWRKRVDFGSPGWGKTYWVLQLGSGGDPVISAFTVAELGEKLPRMSSSIHLKDDYSHKPWNGKWVCLENGKIECVADTEANARAKMLIHLIEKGIIKP